MLRPEKSQAKGRHLWVGAAVLFAGLGVIALVWNDEGAALQVVEIATPSPSVDEGRSDELDAIEALEDDSFTTASSGSVQREVIGEWGEAGEVFLRGRVEGRAKSETVEGARVTVFFKGGEIQTHSASGGEFELAVPAGVLLDVEAFAHGYNTERRSALTPDEELVLRLDRAAVIKGVILGPSAEFFAEGQVRMWADDKRGVTNFSLSPELVVTMESSSDEGSEGSPTLQFAPDERGAFEIVGLEPGEFDLSVEVPGWSYGVERDVILRAGETRYIEFELIRAGSAQARVVYEGTLQGVADCTVGVTPWIQGLNSAVEEGASKTYRTDAEGWVELLWLNPGESRVKIRALNGLIEEVNERLNITTAKREILTWEIPGIYPLSGVVRRENGAVLKGGYVHLFSGSGSEDVYFGGPIQREDDDPGLPRSVLIGGDGSYHFESVPADTSLTLSAVSSEDPPAAGYSRVLLRSSGASDRFGGRGVTKLVADAAIHDFEIEGVLRLEGVVQDAEGEPKAGVKIHLSRMKRGVVQFSPSRLREIINGASESSSSQVTESDAEGRFVLEGFLPSEGWISGELDGYKKQWQRLDVREQVTEILIELQPAPSLTGRVVALGGEPIPWAMVNATKSGSSRRQRERRVYADEFGRFEFKISNGRSESGFLDEGEWSFVARASGRESVDRPRRTVPGAEELLLTMGPVHVADAASLRGKVFIADGTEPTRLRLQQIRSAALSVDGGDFRVTGLNPGTHRLVFEARGCAPKSLGEGGKNELLLREGEERDLGILTMYPGREVDVRVENEDGRFDKAQVRFSPVGGYAVDSGSGTRKPLYSGRGTYYMGALELGAWNMVVRASGHEKVEKEVVLEPGSRLRLTVKLKKNS